MDNLTAASECTNEQTAAVQAIRESSRKSLFLNRRRLKDEETDVRRCIGNCSSLLNVTEIVDKLKTKSSISAEELKILKNALIDDNKTTEVVLNTHGALRGIVRELSGHNATKQCLAAGCLCNMGLGDSKACSVVAKAAGSYLVAFLDNMTEELAEINHDHGEAIQNVKHSNKPKQTVTVTITPTGRDKPLKETNDLSIDKIDDIIEIEEINIDETNSIENFNAVTATTIGSTNFDDNNKKLSKKNYDETEVQFANNLTLLKENVVNIVKVENDDQIVVLLKNDSLMTKDDNDIESFNDNIIAMSEVETNDELLLLNDDILDLGNDIINVEIPNREPFILKKDDSDIKIMKDINDTQELKDEYSACFSTKIESDKGSDYEKYIHIENELDISSVEDAIDTTKENIEPQLRELEVKVRMHKGIQIETPENHESLTLSNDINKFINNKAQSPIQSDSKILQHGEFVDSTDSEDNENVEAKENKTDGENIGIKREIIFSSDENDDETDCSDEDATEAVNEELIYATKQMTEVVIALTNLINRKCVNNEDECDIFGKLLAMRLRKLPENDRLELMREIDELILTRSSREQAMMSCRMSPVSEPEN